MAMFHSQVKKAISERLSLESLDEFTQLNEALRHVSKWRSVLIQITLVQYVGKQQLGCGAQVVRLGW
jgi:hypothetical protein